MAEQLAEKESHIKAALCYVLPIGWIISFFLILTEKDNKYVKFNAVQSVLLLFSYMTIHLVLGLLGVTLPTLIYIDFVIAILSNLLLPFYIVLSLLLMYMSYTGKQLVLPTIGTISERHV